MDIVVSSFSTNHCLRYPPTPRFPPSLHELTIRTFEQKNQTFFRHFGTHDRITVAAEGEVTFFVAAFADESCGFIPGQETFLTGVPADFLVWKGCSPVKDGLVEGVA